MNINGLKFIGFFPFSYIVAHVARDVVWHFAPFGTRLLTLH